MAWAKAVWSASSAAQIMEAAWRKQVHLGAQPDWKAVHGPAAATAMSLRRAGWAWPSWKHFLTKEKLLLDLTKICPMDVKAMMHRDTEAVMWACWTQTEEYQHLHPRPFIQPLVSLMSRRGKGWSTHHTNIVRSVVTSGAVTQQKMFDWKRVDGPTCQSCGQSAGTDVHRYHVCPATKEWRQKVMDRKWQHVAAEACLQAQGANETCTLWTRGLVRDPSADWTFVPIEDRHEEWSKELECRVFSGDVFGDGSKKGSHEWSQCGWAAIQSSEQGDLFACWGPLPVDLPVQRRIKRAELWALLKVLRNCLPPLTFYTDHFGIVQGLQKGKQWCCHASRPHADIWREIWFRLADIGCLEDESLIQVRKVKAHTSKASQQCMTPQELFLVQGNERADAKAKAGADLDANFGRAQALEEYADKVTWSLGAIAAMHMACGEEGWKDAEQVRLVRPVRESKPATLRLEVGPMNPHIFHKQVSSQGWSCEKCGCTVRTEGGLEKIKRTECSGSIIAGLQPATAAEEARPNGHILKRTGPVVFCDKCGRYAHKHLRSLKAACPGFQTALSTQLIRMRTGKHPVSKEYLGPVRSIAREELDSFALRR